MTVSRVVKREKERGRNERGFFILIEKSEKRKNSRVRKSLMKKAHGLCRQRPRVNLVLLPAKGVIEYQKFSGLGGGVDKVEKRSWEGWWQKFQDGAREVHSKT